MTTHFIECTYSHLHIKNRIVHVRLSRIVYIFEQDGKFLLGSRMIKPSVVR